MICRDARAQQHDFGPLPAAPRRGARGAAIEPVRATAAWRQQPTAAQKEARLDIQRRYRRRLREGT